MYKCPIERTDRHGETHDLLLHLGNVPIRLCFGLDLLGDVTDLVLDGANFGVVRRPRDDVKTTRTRPRRDRCMDVRRVVGRQIIPDKNTFIISPSDAIHLDVITHIFTKILKGICRCSDVLDTTNPASRPLNAAIHIRGEVWITWLNGKKDGDLLTMAIMAVLPHPKDFQRPALLPVAPLNRHSELINIDEHPTWDPTNAEGRRMVPESIDMTLNRLCLSLIRLNRGNLLGDIQLLQTLGNCLVGVYLPPLRCRGVPRSRHRSHQDGQEEGPRG